MSRPALREFAMSMGSLAAPLAILCIAAVVEISRRAKAWKQRKRELGKADEH